MFGEIFRFELRQQLGRPVAWLIFFAFATIGALEMIGAGVVLLGAHDGVARNAPLIIANAVSMLSILAILAAGTFATAAALRDFDHRTAQLILSMPVSRRAYLGGRFAAAWLLVLLTMLACMAGIAIGLLLPGHAPVNASGAVAAYPWAFGLIVLPGTLFVTALLFGLAIFTRSLLATFVGVACLIVLLFASHAFMHDAGSQALVAMLDPFGYHTLGSVTRYWPASEINTRLPALSGCLLVNRVMWSGLAIALLAVLLLVRWNLYGVGRAWRRSAGEAAAATSSPVSLPVVTLQRGAIAGWRQFVHWLAFDAARVLRGVPFLVLLLFGLINVALNLVAQPALLGVASLPVTSQVVDMIRSSLDWLLAITLVFYAGELVWRDRELGVAQIRDAMPWPDWVAVAAKACVLALVVVVFLVCGSVAGVAWQSLHGYTHIQPALYLGTLVLTAVPYVLLAMLCLAVQVMCGNRFLGYLLTVLWLVLVKVAAPLLGWRDHLFLYGTMPGLPYSVLNGYGRFLQAVLWFDGYWLLLAFALLVVAAAFWARGLRAPWRRRLRAATGPSNTPARVALSIALLAFVGCGAWIFYNTHVLNQVYDGHRADRQLADYEKAFGRYRKLPQPRIADEKLSVAIYPYRCALDIRGRYTLVNRDKQPIGQLLVWYPNGFRLESVSLPPHVVVSRDAAPHFVVYRLSTPLAPGAKLAFGFHLERRVHGFTNAPTATYLAGNGSFFDNLIGPDRSGHNVLPHIGYQPYLELTDSRVRRRYGLPPVASPMDALDDPAARNVSGVSGDADWVHADITLSTAKDQTAVTAGILQRSWVADERRYFHYVTQAPLQNVLPFVSARYAVRRANMDGTTVELYYDPAEAWNIDRMLGAVRDALAYDIQHFGPYPYHQLRIAVVPYNYEFAAETFPGLMVVRETGPVGPQAQPPRAGSIDPMSVVLGHETSHQWWVVQETPANMLGANLITESFAQYSALMLAKQRYGEAAMRPLLEFQLDAYLQGRHRATAPESPLVSVGDASQGYIYYDKGALAFYALQDYLGEATVNRVLRQFLDATRFKGPPYPTSEQFLGMLDAAAGPKWRSLVDDLFRRITLFDDRMVSASAKKLADGKYQVMMRVHTAKYYADGKGTQTRAELDIPIEIGVFAQAKDGEEQDEKPLFLEKYPVKDGDSTIVAIVDGKPYQAGIDPFNELVDSQPNDNRAQVAISKQPAGAKRALGQTHT